MNSEPIIPWSITPEEEALAGDCLSRALACGADGVRITLNKSLMDLILLRNGSMDKVTHSGDRSMTFCLFVGGRFGTFSTNRFEADELERFLTEAVATTRMLAPDSWRKLPEPSRLVHDAVTGRELGLCDPAYAAMTPEERIRLVREASCFERIRPEGYTLISEETEYSDSVSDLLILDSNGLHARHTETSFELGCEYTIADPDGHKISGYWWDSAPMRADLQTASVCPTALERALAQMGSDQVPGGKYTVVVENEVASKLLNPLLGALSGYSLQQNNSFLTDSLGKKVFCEGFTLRDIPRTTGANGTRYFDSEGVATRNTDIITGGVVRNYFLNTYIAGKMGLDPTQEDCFKPLVMPWWSFGPQPAQMGREEILSACGEGILVTGFNGGNCNSATGDFSYGIEGFAFKDGERRPVHGMVMTGNMIHLWNNLIAAGTDIRPCMNKQVPTLAFKDIDFSA